MMDIGKILSNFTLYADISSLLEYGGREYLSGGLLPLLVGTSRKLHIMSDTEHKLTAMMGDAYKKDVAETALEILTKFDEAGALEKVEPPQNAIEGKAFLPILFAARTSGSVCLLTDDANQAAEVLKLAKNISSAFGLVCVKIGSGTPRLWDGSVQEAGLSPVSWELPRREDAEYHDGKSSAPEPEYIRPQEIRPTVNLQPKLLISFVVDNSIDTGGEKFEIFKSAFYSFKSRFDSGRLKERMEFSLTLYEGFEPRVMKNFGDDSINFEALKANKIPFLDKAINKSLDLLVSRREELERQGCPLYKSWMFILSEGQTFDDLGTSIERLRKMDMAKELLYMPFLLSDKPVPDKLMPLSRAKRIVKITDNKYSQFFDWISAMAVKRIDTPTGGTFKFEKEDFEGWTAI